MLYIPTVIEKTGNFERVYDIYSRMLQERIIILGSQINDEVANSIVAQLLYLEYQDSKKEITIYINSPGGVVTSGMAILDTMNLVKAPVSTVCIGQACSMGALLLACGTKGKRYSLPNSRIMIHQPLGGAEGQATDIMIQAEEIIRIKKNLSQILADQTGKDIDLIYQDTDRDNFLTPEAAKQYGLIDEVITSIESI
jgi:ATP-dependent Clp protease protease subunit